MPTTTKYIWDEDNLLAEADGSDTIHTVYTNEPQRYGNLISTRLPIAGTPTTVYHHYDALGSTRQLTNAVGGTTDTMTYDVWGNVVSRTGSTGANLLWIGEVGYYHDSETGLNSAGARQYGPVIARWTSPDPLFLPGAFGLYIYSDNLPTMMVDPSGLFCVPVDAAIPKTCKDRAPWTPTLCLLNPPCTCADTMGAGQPNKGTLSSLLPAAIKEVFNSDLGETVGAPALNWDGKKCKLYVKLGNCNVVADVPSGFTCLDTARRPSKDDPPGTQYIYVCVPNKGQTPCNVREILIHEFVHAMQLCSGAPIDEPQAYLASCRERLKQTCDPDFLAAARTLVGNPPMAPDDRLINNRLNGLPAVTDCREKGSKASNEVAEQNSCEELLKNKQGYILVQ